MTADNKYSALNRQSLTQSIQMQLSRNLKNFGLFFFAFLKCSSNFEHAEKKVYLHSLRFPILRTAKNVIKQMSKKSRFRKLFNKQCRKCSERLLKSWRQRL